MKETTPKTKNKI